MARITGPKDRYSRREGVELFGKKKSALLRRENPPGKGDRSRRGRRPSEYGIRLREKQKTKRLYGVMERQFRRVFEIAKRKPGNTGVNLLVLLERRLDNAVFGMGFGNTRPMARQMIVHGHITVNGKKVSCPSALVRAGDKITVRPKDGSKKLATDGIAMSRALRSPPSWVDVNDDTLEGTVVNLPKREDVPIEINELFVVEVCSR
jgi:small subunit ribosomal protein S4